MSTKALIPYEGGSNLILGYRYRKLNIFSKNSSHYQLFSPSAQKLSLWCEKKSLPTQIDLCDPYMVPYTIP